MQLELQNIMDLQKVQTGNRIPKAGDINQDPVI